MRYAAGVAVLAVVLVVVLLAMRSGWRARGARSATLVPVLPPVPDPDRWGAARTEAIEALYVSTTVAGDWLDRVVAHDLGVRSAATVQVHDAGVVLSRTGAQDVFLPAHALREVVRSPGIAGKVAPGRGLVVVRWEVPGSRGSLFQSDVPAEPTVLDTGVRARRAADAEVLLDAVAALVAEHAAADGLTGTPTGPPSETPTEETT